jgi:hypothetical protein
MAAPSCYREAADERLPGRQPKRQQDRVFKPESRLPGNGSNSPLTDFFYRRKENR